MKDKKGFTLVELITVLSVLALLSLIVMPVMVETISNSKQKALQTQKEYLIDAAQKYAMEISNGLPVYEGAKYTITLDELRKKAYIDEEDIVDPKTDKVMKGCVELTYIAKSQKYSYNYVDTCANYAQGPVLDDSMIPVIYSGGKWVTAGNSIWYNYESRNWANAAVVKKSALNKYKNKKTNIEIADTDILGIFVWIPRFSYTIQTKNSSSSTTYGYNSTNINSPGSISIKFINRLTTDEGIAYFMGSVETNYKTHDAFYNDINNNGIREENEELAGIWVGKFQTTANNLCTQIPNVENCNKIFTNDISIMGNQKYLTNQSIENQYQTARQFSRTSNITLESKMMNNKEYGALLYLTQSIYGRCSSKTSCSNFSKNTSSLSGGGVNYITNTSFSSTNNATGVYDMSGSIFQRVLAVYNNPFNFDINKRYYDSYDNTGNDVACSGSICYGHGLSETNKWYSSSQNPTMPNELNPFFKRGVNSSISTSTSYYYSEDDGLPSSNTGFRIVLQAN